MVEVGETQTEGIGICRLTPIALNLDLLTFDHYSGNVGKYPQRYDFEFAHETVGSALAGNFAIAGCEFFGAVR